MVTEIYNSGIIPIILTGIFITYGCINAKNVIEKEYNIYTDKNIRMKDIKLILYRIYILELQWVIMNYKNIVITYLKEMLI